MSNKLNLRVGDVVRLKPMKVESVFEGGILFQEGYGYVSDCQVEEIISRAETPEETIARLEAELAKAPRRIEWSGGECPIEKNDEVYVWLRNGEKVSHFAGSCNWTHSNHSHDIIAYMVLPQ